MVDIIKHHPEQILYDKIASVFNVGPDTTLDSEQLSSD